MRDEDANTSAPGLEELTPWLFGRVSGGIRWGLERTEELLAGAGNPHRRFHSLHVGGTNGKGSVAAMCDAVLRSDSRRRVGLYTSPHLIGFEERIRIDGDPIARDTLLELADRLRPAVERTDATFFETTTAMAFLAFAEANVELAVVEVGLGGRLDATNVLTPLVSAVTNVAVDHTEYLGSELKQIAREKAGIVKPGVPFLSGVAEPALAEVFERRAREVAAPYHALDRMASIEAVRMDPVRGTSFRLRSRRWGEQPLETGLLGSHQARNAAFAAELLGLLPTELRPSPEALARGFHGVRWPGRLQVEAIRATTWVFDVAHNPDGARTLNQGLTALKLPEPRVLVVGILADKDWREMLRSLIPGAAATILTVPRSAPPGRRWDLQEAAAWCSGEMGIDVRVIPDLAAALMRATTLAPHGTIVVTGSIHTVGDAMLEMGVRPV